MRVQSGDPTTFTSIVHRVGHMMWVNVFFLGKLLLRENEILIGQESEALIPHFDAQLVLHGLRE